MYFRRPRLVQSELGGGGSQNVLAPLLDGLEEELSS